MLILIFTSICKVKETPYFQKKTTLPFDDHGARVFASDAGGTVFVLLMYLFVVYLYIGWGVCLFGFFLYRKGYF